MIALACRKITKIYGARKENEKSHARANFKPGIMHSLNQPRIDLPHQLQVCSDSAQKYLTVLKTIPKVVMHVKYQLSRNICR